MDHLTIAEPTLDKSSFKPETRYTVTLRDEAGHLAPASFYVYRTYDRFMIVRSVQNDGLLRKLAYDDVERIVAETPADPQHVFHTPSALLEEKFWQDRSVLQHYATAPGLGK